MWSIGSIEAQLVTDGSAANPRELVFANVPPELLDRELKPGPVVTSYDSLLIRSDSTVALVDTGMGEHAAAFGAEAGRCSSPFAALEGPAAGVAVIDHEQGKRRPDARLPGQAARVNFTRR